MGCDGGTIPTRGELVKQKPKPEQVDKEAEKAATWKYCSVSQEELQKPIVVCQLGRLYNKETILNYLLAKEPIPNSPHIKNLKCVKEVKLTERTNNIDDQASSSTMVEKVTQGVKTGFKSKFICPIMGIDMNGTHKFCVIWKCGCVLSEKAIKEIKVQQCPNCNITYDRDFDIVTLYPDTPEEIELLRQKMATRLEQTVAKRDAKQHSNNKDDTISQTKASAKRALEGEKSSKQHTSQNNRSSLPHSASPKGKILDVINNKDSIIRAAVVESKKKLCREEIFSSKTYKSIFKTPGKPIAYSFTSYRS